MNHLTSWDPFKELNRLLEGGSTELANSQGREWAPAVDIVEDDETFTITADFPDVKKEDVKVSVEKGVLTLSGERHLETEEEDKKKKYHRIERKYGSYVRSFALPDNVDGSSVKAEFKEGVLRINLPKVSEEEAGNKVEIEVN